MCRYNARRMFMISRRILPFSSCKFLDWFERFHSSVLCSFMSFSLFRVLPSGRSMASGVCVTTDILRPDHSFNISIRVVLNTGSDVTRLSIPIQIQRDFESKIPIPKSKSYPVTSLILK